MTSRLVSFQDCLRRLSLAGIESYEQLQVQALIEKETLEIANYEIPDPKGNLQLFNEKEIDIEAKHLLPSSHYDFIPIKTLGDGNCLFRSGSLIAFNDQSHHEELRVRVVIELVTNEEFYLRGGMVESQDRENYVRHLALVSRFSREASAIDNELVKCVFEKEAVESCQNRAWSSMWNLHALCSVLNRPIFSIYPDLSGREKRYLHRQLKPREFSRNGNGGSEIGILWSKIGPSSSELWNPNHFVPCFQVINNNESSNLSSLQILFPMISNSWYYKRGRLALSNVQREKYRRKKKAHKDGDLTHVKFDNEEVIVDVPNLIKQTEQTMVKYISNDRMLRVLSGCIGVLEHLLNKTPVMPVKHLTQIYQVAGAAFFGEEPSIYKIKPTELMEVLRNNGIMLNMFYFREKAFATSLSQIQLEPMFSQIQETENQKMLNDAIEDRIGDLYKSSLDLMETKRDKDTLKGVIATATSGTFAAKLQGVKNKRSSIDCKNQLTHRIELMKTITQTSMPVRNDMTNRQQHMFWRRLITARLCSTWKLPYENRGRKLKAEEFPEMISIMESFFDDEGMESHPRLTTSTLFRSSSNKLLMHQARQKILLFAPENFTISLSSCFNYTSNYKENSYAAKRHHHGMNINADISLKRPPRSNARMVINLHWTSSNVKLLVQNGSDIQNWVVDSKDAKNIIPGDITPVQKPGKSWKKVIAPDHDWDQGRDNAVTPMTHLFLQTKVCSQVENKVENVVESVVTRSGKACTLINLSYYEADTTFRRLNEIFLLLSMPSLDSNFRNQQTGKLKPIFAFIVDNGPGESPSSFLLQMLLVRLVNYLNLDKAVQLSFAEYHSKRNFVERVHATENEMISRHGPFRTKQVHPSCKVGDKEHMENMEKMAEDVISCIGQGQFSGLPLTCCRGITDDQFLFNDEEKLRQFLMLSEEKKEECSWTYELTRNKLSEELSVTWGLPQEFERSYYDDYKTLTNQHGTRTCWKDKYTCTIYRENDFWKVEANSDRRITQPIPDYERWRRTKELHYMSNKKFELLNRFVSTEELLPGTFIPSQVLNTVLRISLDLPKEILPYIALLSWLPLEELEMYIAEKVAQEKNLLTDAVELETYRHETLYKSLKSDLIQKCKDKSLPWKCRKKHELVKSLCQKTCNKNPPVVYEPKDIVDVPANIAKLRKLNMADCRSILRKMGISTVGSKDELVRRLFLLKNKRASLMFKKEIRILSDLIDLAEKIMHGQQQLAAIGVGDEREKRKYSSSCQITSLDVPEHFEDLTQVFSPLKTYLNALKCTEQNGMYAVNTEKDNDTMIDDPYEEFFEIGTKVRVKWTKDEVANSGWKAGWYVAYVTDLSRENDSIAVVYSSEPESVYHIDVSTMLNQGMLELQRKP